MSNIFAKVKKCLLRIEMIGYLQCIFPYSRAPIKKWDATENEGPIRQSAKLQDTFSTRTSEFLPMSTLHGR